VDHNADHHKNLSVVISITHASYIVCFHFDNLKCLGQMNLSHESGKDARSSHHKALKDLEAEMKLLKWHKLANESALQAALLRTKSMRKEEARMKPLLEKATRMKNRERLKKAREEEEAKPLVEVRT
jgi:hypothetical protein